jgi:hydrophobe/amphiphile efflux-3 (HAE3) family protein
MITPTSAWSLPLRFPRATLLVLLAAVVLALPGLRDLRTDFGLEQLLPRGDAEVVRYRELAAESGRDDNSVFVFVTRDDLFTPRGLYFVVELARELGSSPLVEEVQSLASVPLATSGQAGLDVSAPFDPERVARIDFDALKRRLLAERVFARRLLSEDGRTTVLAVRVKDEYYGDGHRAAIVAHVDEVLELFGASGVDFIVTGNAPTRHRYVAFVRRDNRLFLPLAFALLAAALLLLFRRPSWALLTCLALGTSLVATLAFMKLAGRPVTLLSSAIPVLVLVVGLSDTIHLLARYQEELAGALGREAALARALAATARSCLLSTVTTAVGFFVLPLTGIPILSDFGIVVGTGVLLAYAVSLSLVPAALALLPAPRNGSDLAASERLARLGAWVVDHRGGVLAAAAATVVGLGLLGVPRVRVESRILDDLPPGHPLLQTRAAVEARLGGNFPMTFVVHPRAPGTDAALDPGLLRAVLRFQDELAAGDRTGVLSSTLSAADFIGMAWRASGSQDRLPDRREDVARMRGELGELTLGRSFDRARGALLVDVRVYDRGTEATARFLEHARATFSRTVGDAGRLELSGFAYLSQRVHESVVWSSMTSFLLDFAVVSVLMLLASRSWRLATLAITPNLVPLVLTVAFMGLCGIELRISSSIVFAIVYGIAIDDTVHFLARYREERAAGLDERAAVVRTMATTGRAMVLMAAVLAAGFSILTLSQFQANRVLGLLMAVTVACGLAADLVLLPALLAPSSPRAAR